MTYSKTHQRFSEKLNQPDALTDPEKYLGPNYQDVLNFWFYVEGLSLQKIEEMNDRYWALDDNVRVAAGVAAEDAADEVVGSEFRDAAWWAAIDVTRCGVFSEATSELIAHHKLLDQNKIPLALSFCVKP